MTKWLNKLTTKTKLLAASAIVMAQGAYAGPLGTQINAAIEKDIVKIMVSGACVALGILEAFKLWKEMFGGGGGDSLWKSVLTLLGWLLLALYWQEFVKNAVVAFGV